MICWLVISSLSAGWLLIIYPTFRQSVVVYCAGHPHRVRVGNNSRPIAGAGMVSSKPRGHSIKGELFVVGE